MVHFPTDVVSHILHYCSTRDIVGDDLLDKFLINKCVNIDKNNLITAFVKKSRYKSLHLLLQKTHSKGFAEILVRDLILKTMRDKEFQATDILFKGFNEIICSWGTTFVKTCFIEICKDKIGKYHDVYMTLIEDIIMITGVKQLTIYHLPTYILLKILDHPKGKLIMAYLTKYNLITYLYKKTFHESIGNNTMIDIINKIIINNHVYVLKRLVGSGYELDVNDVILTIACSNIEMIEYVMKYFKPRFYNKAFRKLMYAICTIRNDALIRHIVKRKLG
jgi:hypothetical protein